MLFAKIVYKVAVHAKMELPVILVRLDFFMIRPLINVPAVLLDAHNAIQQPLAKFAIQDYSTTLIAKSVNVLLPIAKLV